MANSSSTSDSSGVTEADVGDAGSMMVDGEEYDVEAILEAREHDGRDFYLVKWAGFDEPTWEPMENCVHLDQAEAFESGQQTPTTENDLLECAECSASIPSADAFTCFGVECARKSCLVIDGEAFDIVSTKALCPRCSCHNHREHKIEQWAPVASNEEVEKAVVGIITDRDGLDRLFGRSPGPLGDAFSKEAGGGFRVSNDGYVPESEWHKVKMGCSGTPVQDEKLSECCKEIQKNASEELDGQLVFPHRDAIDVMVMRLWPMAKCVFEICARNRLTKAAAAGLIHLLYHLDECAMQQLWIQRDLSELRDEQGLMMGALNPRIFATYRAIAKKPLRVYAESVSVDALRNSTAILTAQQLIANSSALYETSYDIGQVQNETLSFPLTARSYYSKVFLGLVPLDVFDRIVQFYRDYDGDIQFLVPEVRLWLGGHWPAAFPVADAQVVMTEEWREMQYYTMEKVDFCRRDYIYSFENTASGRRFMITFDVECRRSIEEGKNGQLIRGERLNAHVATLRLLKPSR